MTGKIIDFLKDGSVVIPKILLMNYKSLKITEKELVVLICLIDNNEFDPEKIGNMLNIKVVDVLSIINSLTKKDIIKLISVVNNNVCEEYISLDNLYNKLALSFMDKKEDLAPSNIYDRFEKEFARTLSPMEFEIIGAWIDDGFAEETIYLALKEAVYNGVTNLRYIDKILYEWKKKGIKTKSDVDNQKDDLKGKSSKKEVFDYDWLNE